MYFPTNTLFGKVKTIIKNSLLHSTHVFKSKTDKTLPPH